MLWLASLIAALPPITSLQDASLQLRSGTPEAVANVTLACKGRYRRDLKDRPELREKLLQLYPGSSAERRLAILDTDPCFSPKELLPLIELGLSDEDDAVVAHAAEVATRAGDVQMIAAIQRRFDVRADRCLAVEASGPLADACTWLTYAQGALLGDAAEPVRVGVAERAVKMFVAKLPKLREVAVESLAATRLARFAADLTALITRETQKGGLALPNDASIVARFRERERSLKKGQAPSP